MAKKAAKKTTKTPTKRAKRSDDSLVISLDFDKKSLYRGAEADAGVLAD